MPHSVLFMAQNHPSGKPLHDYCLEAFFLSDQVFLMNFFIDGGHESVSQRCDAAWCWELQSQSRKILDSKLVGSSFINTWVVSWFQKLSKGFNNFVLCCFPISMKQARGFSVFSTVYFTFSFVSGKSVWFLCSSTFLLKIM